MNSTVYTPLYFGILLASSVASTVYTPLYLRYIAGLLSGIHIIHTTILSAYRWPPQWPPQYTHHYFRYIAGLLSELHSMQTTILSAYCWPPQWPPQYTHHYTFGILLASSVASTVPTPLYFRYIAGLLSELHSIHTTLLSVYCWPPQWTPQYPHHYTFGILLVSSVASTVPTQLYFRYIAGLLSGLPILHTTILSVYCWPPQRPPQYTHHYTFGILLVSSVTSTVYTPLYFRYIAGLLSELHSIHTTILSVYCWPPQWTQYTHHYTFGILLASSVTSTVYKPLYFRYIAGLLSELHSIHNTILSVYWSPPQWTPQYTHHYTFGILLASSVTSTVYTPLYFRYIAGLLSELHGIHTTILSVYCWPPQWPPWYTHHYTFGILLASSVASTVYTPLYFRYIAGLLSGLHIIHTTILSVYCWPPQWPPRYTHHYTFGILLASSVASTVPTQLYFQHIADLLSELHSIHTTNMFSVYYWHCQSLHNVQTGILSVCLLAFSAVSTIMYIIYTRVNSLYVADILSVFNSMHTVPHTHTLCMFLLSSVLPHYTHHYTFSIR